MKHFILILIAAFTFVGCSNNPLQGTQWEGINDVKEEIPLISFDKDTCTVYVFSRLSGETNSIGFKYELNGNTINLTPIKIPMQTPALLLDGNFLINKETNVPQFKKAE